MAYTPLHPQKPLSVEALYTVHYFEYSGSYAFPGETHDFWEFLYVDKGILRVTAGERTWELSTGQMIFHQKNALCLPASSRKAGPPFRRL